MRGFFAVGAEGISKAMNVGAIFRTANAFGASFVFTVGATYDRQQGKLADTSSAHKNIPFFKFAGVDEMLLPAGCKLVGIELTDDAIDLPSFCHPQQAAYILGPERASLSLAMQSRCDHIVKIPTRFCINVSMAAGIVIYDRTLQLGRYTARPVWEGAPQDELPKHVRGAPIFRKQDTIGAQIKASKAEPPNLDILKDRLNED